MTREEKMRYMPGTFGIFLGLTQILQILFVIAFNIPKMILSFFISLIPTQGKKLTGKHVLITGSANGIGRAMSFEFAKQGSKIICVDINQTANEKAVKEINEMTGKSNTAKSYICDVSDLEAIKKLAKEVLEDYGHIDILVSNAGIIYGKTILNEEEDMAKKVLNVNQMSSYWLVRNFLPNMKERNDGHLVFINSMASLTPLGDATMYTVTKFALLGLTAALLDEFSRDPSCSNIKISSVHPFFMATDGLKAQPMSSRLLMMNVDNAAAQIVNGIRKEYIYFTVPGNQIGYWFLSLSKIMPYDLYKQLVHTVYSHVLLPEKKP